MPDDQDARIILAYTEPPAEYGFTASKSGRSYWKKVPSLELAQPIAADLAALGIHGKIKKLGPPTPYFPRRNGQMDYARRRGNGGLKRTSQRLFR